MLLNDILRTGARTLRCLSIIDQREHKSILFYYGKIYLFIK